MFTFFNISDIATDPSFRKVCYRFSTDYYSILPHLGNIRRKPRVTRHNLSLVVGVLLVAASVADLVILSLDLEILNSIWRFFCRFETCRNSSDYHRGSGEYWRLLGFGNLAEVDTACYVLLFHY